jgi:hypothetical protein
MTDRPVRPPKTHAAAGARLVVAGVAALAGLGLVGAMAAAAQIGADPPTPEVIHRVVLIDGQSVDGENPLPAPVAASAEPQAESSGS